MKQSSYYFQHDYNAANDYKILFLRQQLGIEGYGIYWYVVEQLALSGGKLPLKIVPVLSMQIQTTPDKVSSVIKNYDLFVIEQEEFFSKRLVDQIEYRTLLSEAGKRGGLKSGKNRRNKATLEAPLQAPLEQRKGKERKESKENIYITVSDEIVNDPLQLLEFYAAQLNGMERENHNIAWRPLVKEWFADHAEESFNDQNHVKNSFKKFYLYRETKKKPSAEKVNPYKIQ